MDASLVFLPLSFFLLSAVTGLTAQSNQSCSLADGLSGSCRLRKDCWKVQYLPAVEKCSSSSNVTEEWVCCPEETASGLLARQYCDTLLPAFTAAIPNAGIFVSGGTKSEQKHRPYMVLIGYGDADDKMWRCGGTLISRKHVVTAAHCVVREGVEDPPRWAMVGDSERHGTHPCRQERAIVESHPYPEYKPSVNYHDIAVLVLDREVLFSPHVFPACLNVDPITNAFAVLSGFGPTELCGPPSKYLLEAQLDIMPNIVCEEVMNASQSSRLYKGLDTDTQFCAGSPGKDACFGDSGGPLVVDGKAHQELVGVVSFGDADCSESTTPGIYTRVSAYVPWIEKIAFPAQPTVFKLGHVGYDQDECASPDHRTDGLKPIFHYMSANFQR